MAKEKAKEEPEQQTESAADKEIAKDLIGNAMAGVAKIKLSGGVVGRIALISIAGVAVVGTAAVSSAFGANAFVCGGVILSATILTLTGLKWTLDYAKKNPLTATMEGAQLLVHQRIKTVAQRSKSKARIAVRKKDVIPDPTQPPLPALGHHDVDQPDDPGSSEPPQAKDGGET